GSRWTGRSAPRSGSAASRTSTGGCWRHWAAPRGRAPPRSAAAWGSAAPWPCGSSGSPRSPGLTGAPSSWTGPAGPTPGCSPPPRRGCTSCWAPRSGCPSSAAPSTCCTAWRPRSNSATWTPSPGRPPGCCGRAAGWPSRASSCPAAGPARPRSWPGGWTASPPGWTWRTRCRACSARSNGPDWPPWRPSRSARPSGPAWTASWPGSTCRYSGRATTWAPTGTACSTTTWSPRTDPRTADPRRPVLRAGPGSAAASTALRGRRACGRSPGVFAGVSGRGRGRPGPPCTPEHPGPGPRGPCDGAEPGAGRLHRGWAGKREAASPDGAVASPGEPGARPYGRRSPRQQWGGGAARLPGRSGLGAHPRGAGLDGEPGAVVDRGAGLGDVVQGPVDRGPLGGRDRVADVAAPAVDELDVRVLLELDGVAGVLLGAVPAASERGADQLGGDGGRVRVAEVGLDVAHVVGVHVAGDHHRPGRLGQPVADLVALHPVVVPGVVAEVGRRTVGEVPLGEEDLLGQDVPAGRGGVQAVEEPPLLLGAQQGARGVVAPVVARLHAAVLAGVEQVDVEQAAEGEPAVQPHVGAVRALGRAQRHVLVVGLEGPRAAAQELLRGHVVLIGGVVGPVVLHLVVVEDHRPGERGVRGLQVGVGLVLGVPDPVVGQRLGLPGGGVRSADLAGLAGLVDVVAEEGHQVQVL